MTDQNELPYRVTVFLVFGVNFAVDFEHLQTAKEWAAEVRKTGFNHEGMTVLPQGIQTIDIVGPEGTIVIPRAAAFQASAGMGDKSN